MSFSMADARFLFDRCMGLIRRGLLSLRTRGPRASWERMQAQLQRATPEQRAVLYFPAKTAFAPFSVPCSDAPVASIVIPVFNQFAHTLLCLRSLADHPPGAACEIIVVDDGSSDATAECLSQVQGLRYHRRSENSGFIAACNDGAGLARGDVIVFLNNDTVPQPGWLDALLRTFDQHPRTGLAGAQLLYPDGRLQEAGGVVFADGSGWNYGKFGAYDDPRYAYVRDADYCSGAAIAIPRTLFDALGGFDSRYAPAYYEDTDFAFGVRAAGHRVMYQPSARVVHVEGATAGSDTGAGVKAYQVRNQAVFAEKWAPALQRQPAPGHEPTPAVLHANQRQILIIDALTPQPDHDSGSLRLVNLMRLLREEGAHVVFLSSNRSHAGIYTEALQQLGVEVWYAPHAKRPPAWLREHGTRFDTIMVCRHYVAVQFLDLLREHAPRAKIVFDTVDLHYLRELRGAELAGDAALRRGAMKTRTRELDVIARSDVTLVVSDTEHALLARDAPDASVEVLSNLHQLAGPGQTFAQREDLVFVGGFRHPPNVDAVCWFVEHIFALIRERLPSVKFHCIGHHAPPEVLALAAHAGVIVHGHVADIAPYMDGARIAIAPLRYGAGVKGKINMSMAHGQPVVATSCAVEGMHLRDGHDVLVGDTANTFADAVVRLYLDESLWGKLSCNGLENVERHFSLDAARDVVRRVFFQNRIRDSSL
ncbi:MAG: glycosyltransferase [Pseudomonadota bacterium]|nr:glycosyltransferase [Pseudomonadota bacterium]